MVIAVAVVHNNPKHSTLRLVGLLISLAGVALFILLMFAGRVGTESPSFENRADSILFFIKHYLLFPGIVPLIIIPWFLIKFKTVKVFFIGLFVVLPLMVILHFIVGAALGHQENSFGYISLQLIELSLVPFFYWRRNIYFS